MEASRYTRILSRGSLASVILLLSGCNSALLDPKGAIGVQEKELIITALLLMLIVVIPVILMTIYFAYRYRASNTHEEYALSGRTRPKSKWWYGLFQSSLLRF